MTSRRQTALGAWLRLLVGLLLLQLVGAQLWPALHHAFFTHAVCAEHGELVHLSAHGDPLVTGPDDEALAISALGSEDDAHDHCQLPPATQQPTAVASEPASPVISSSRRASTVVDDAGPCRPIPILALAPKQSPPS